MNRPSGTGRNLVAAASAVILSVLLVVAAILLAPAHTLTSGWLAVVGLPFALFGALLISRVGQNPMGWLFAGWGLVMLFGLSAGAYAERALVLSPGSLPGPAVVVWAANTLWHPAFALLAFILFLFPNGQLPSPRWRWVAWATVAIYVVVAVCAAVSVPVVNLYEEIDPQLFVLPFSEAAAAIGGILLVVAQVLFLLGAGSIALVVKLRRARGDERLQIMWLIYTILMVVSLFVAGLLLFGGGVLYPLFAVIPAVGMLAISRRRLYEIDRLVSRTVSYAVVVGALTGLYASSVWLASRTLPSDSDLAVAASTLAVAAAFNPLRRRVQHWVDRYFNRTRFDYDLELERFMERLRKPTQLTTIKTDLEATISRTLQPATLVLWLEKEARDGQTQ